MPRSLHEAIVDDSLMGKIKKFFSIEDKSLVPYDHDYEKEEKPTNLSQSACSYGSCSAYQDPAFSEPYRTNNTGPS